MAEEVASSHEPRPSVEPNKSPTVGTPAPPFAEAWKTGTGPVEASAVVGDDSDAIETLGDYEDRSFDVVGRSGRFQVFFCLILTWPWVVLGLQTTVHIFVTHVEMPIVDCSAGIPENIAGGSLSANFGLVCASAGLQPALLTLFFLGCLAGSLILSSVADRLGRRTAYVLSTTALQAGALAAMFAPTYSAYGAARLLTGFGAGGASLTSCVWCAEVLSLKDRGILVLTTNAGYAVGAAFASPLAFALPHWRTLSAAVFAAGLPLFATLPWLQESPVWLTHKKRSEQLYEVFCAIAAVNRRPCPPRPPGSAKPPSARAPTGAGAPDPSAAGLSAVPSDLGLSAVPSDLGLCGALAQLLCDGRLAPRFLTMCLAWFALALCYYGLSVNLAEIGSSVYTSSALACLMELPAYVVALWTIDSALSGRRGTVGGGLVAGGCLCVVSGFLMREDGAGRGPSTFVFCLLLAGKFFVSLSFSVIYLYAAELFPTDLRSRSMGFQSQVSRIGAMISPLVARLGATSEVLALVIFGAPALLAGSLAVCVLPETRGRAIPCTVADLPSTCSRSRPLVGCGQNSCGTRFRSFLLRWSNLCRPRSTSSGHERVIGAVNDAGAD